MDIKKVNTILERAANHLLLDENERLLEEIDNEIDQDTDEESEEE